MMRTWLIGLFLAGVLVAVAGRAHYAQEAPGENASAAYIPPESFTARGALDEFIAHAREFLAQHPKDAAAPRAAMDLLMAASVKRDTAVQSAAAAHLVFDHPGSLQAAYFLTTYGQNHAQYKSFLQTQFEAMAPTLAAETAVKFTRAVELGVRQWGPGFLSGDDFLLQCALAAKVAGALNIEFFCKERLRSASETTRRIAEISLGRDSAAAKFLALSAIGDNKSARQHQSYFLRQLSDQERGLAEVRRVIAATLLAEKKFAEALPIVDGLLSESPSDQLQYWKAWCLASKGQEPSALAELAQLVAKYPDSPYLPAAAELTASLGSLVENLDDHAETLDRAFSKLRSGEVSRIESQLGYVPKAGGEVEIYLALDTSGGETLELVVQKNKATVLAFRSSPQGCRLFTQGDAAVHEYARSGVYLAPQLAFHPAADGSFQFNWSANLQGAPGGAASALQGVASSPVLATKQNILALLRHAVARGTFPSPVRQRAGMQVCSYLTPQADGPEISRGELSVDASGMLTGFHFDKLTCRRLKYGRTGDFEFSSPAWPDLPKSEHDQFDAATMFRFMAAAMSLLQEQSAP